MKKKQLPSLQELDEALVYDPLTGILKWRSRPDSHFPNKRIASVWRSNYAGKEAGSRRGYAIIVVIKNKLYAAHRIAWVMSGLPMPEDRFHIDHINSDPYDNRISNLRLATHAQNLQNRPKQANNTSGVKGVTKSRGLWYAQMWMSGTKVFAKGYKTKAEAAVAYAKASLRYHGKFSPYYKVSASI